MQSSVEKVKLALDTLRQGKMVILLDDPERENEGDLIFPAEIITPEVINFMIRHCSGIICLPLLPDKVKQLGLNLMVPPHENSSQRGTPFTVSIEAKAGVTTGVSAADRTTTILTAIQDDATADSIVKPGHIFPLQAKIGGVLERAGHTEGAVDLARLAGFKPAAVLCEMMNPDGTMMRGEALQEFAQHHQLTLLTIEDLITYRLCTENLIAETASADLPLSYGDFTITVIKEKFSAKEHIILTHKHKKSNLVRIHSSCTTGDLFGSLRCDCHQQLHYALQCIANEGGTLIYLQQEGRGIGLSNKIKSYALQEKGLDTVEANEKLGMPADSRNYSIAACILKSLNINSIRLLTNNPAKIADLKKYGIADVKQEVLPVFCTKYNKNYLKTKKSKLNHLFMEL